jgi:hypothetical protein
MLLTLWQQNPKVQNNLTPKPTTGHNPESVSYAHPFPILTTYFSEMPHKNIPTSIFVFYVTMLPVLELEIFSHQYCTNSTTQLTAAA